MDEITMIGLVVLLVLGALLGVGILIGNVLARRRGKDDSAPAAAAPPLRDNILVRYALIAIITGALLIPLGFVHGLIKERQHLQNDVVRGIAASWGGTQTFSGPALVIPVTERKAVVKDIKQADGTTTQQSTVEIHHYNYTILPDMLDCAISLNPEERHRSIYRYTVFTAGVQMKATFTLPDLTRELRETNTLHLNRAYLVFGVSDPTGIKSLHAAMTASFLGGNVALEATPGTNGLLSEGFSIPLDRELGGLASNKQTFSVDMTLAVDGSGGVRVVPVGERTLLAIQSSWPHPNFTGAKLPTTRDITAQGFTATWDIPHLARSFAQRTLFAQGSNTRAVLSNSIGKFTVGVDLFEPVTYYSLINRATKHGILFIAMTFVAMLAFEAAVRARMHLVQYGLVGLAMVAFYLTLLSLAEHVAFTTSYIAASAVSIGMICVYVWASMRSARHAAGMGVLLTALYLLLFALLRMEDYALLVGTGLVLCMLGVLMYVTRNLGSRATH